MKLKNNISFESIIRIFEELYNKSYNALELAELRLCYDQQFPLDKFAKLSTHCRMCEVRLGLEAGVDLFQHAKECNNYRRLEVTRQIAVAGFVIPVEHMKQMTLPALIEIRKGLYNGIDVSIYAKPEFKWQQMREIREGLEAGIDVSSYADPAKPWTQMSNMRKQLMYTWAR